MIIEMWPIAPEMKPRLMRKITDAFVSEGIPETAINIVIHETSKENWATSGKQHSVLHRE